MKIYQTKFHHFCTVIETLYIYEFQIYTEKSKIVLFHFKQENLLMKKKKRNLCKFVSQFGFSNKKVKNWNCNSIVYSTV